MRPMQFLVPAALAAGIALSSAEAAADALPPSFSLIAHFGRYPASIRREDAAYQTVGLLYVSGPPARREVQGAGQAVGVLVSPCHVATSRAAIAEIAADAELAAGLRFSLAPSSAAGEASRSWAVRAVPPPPGVERSPRWALLRLSGCDESVASSSWTLLESGLEVRSRQGSTGAQRSRQIGVLIAKGDEVLPIMIGGAFQQYDALLDRWVTTGIAVAAAPERAGELASVLPANGSAPIGGRDDGVSAFLRRSAHVEPLADIVHSARGTVVQQISQEPGT